MGDLLIIHPPQLPHHIPKTKDSAKNKLRIVLRTEDACLGCGVREGHRRGGRGEPFFLVDA